MTTMVLERKTLPESLSSYFVTPRIAVSQTKNGGEVTLSPVIDPNDYDNDTDYLNAIPGMMESIMESINAPKSERVPLKKVWPDVFDRIHK